LSLTGIFFQNNLIKWGANMKRIKKIAEGILNWFDQFLDRVILGG
jgi:hypothetical protein